MSNIISIVGGILLLITGRKLYWLFVAIIGFFTGLALATMFVKTDVEWIQWLVAIGIGLLGVILAIGLQKVAVGLAGFIAGGYGLTYFLEVIGANIGNFNWVLFIVGGIVGTILVLAVFEFALILLSSVAGATLVSQAINFSGWGLIAIFLCLVLLGLLIQTATLRAEGKKS